MADSLELYVRFENQEVGVIKYLIKEDKYLFVYDEEWIRARRFPISPHIPYQEQKQGVLKRFLENLLPEGQGLDDLSRLTGVSKANVFALVHSIGRDLSGALEISSRRTAIETKFRGISHAELVERIGNRQKESIIIWDGRPRLSIAGVQQKLPLLKKDDEYGLGEGLLASTHILKFGRSTNRHIVLNEHLCMQLAQLVGLKTAETKVVDFGERVLEIKRFDREWVTTEAIKRTHVIDGCQALDIGPEHKYERFLGDEESVQDILGPASLKNLFDFCDQCRVPAKARMDLLHWVAFSLYIGNSDNHVKNLSFFVSDSGLELAPFYDLLSVTIYPDLNHSLAFCIGEAFDPSKVNEHQLLLMASELDIPLSFVKRQFQIILKNLKRALGTVELELQNKPLNREEGEFIGQLTAHINSNISRYQSILEDL